MWLTSLLPALISPPHLYPLKINILPFAFPNNTFYALKDALSTSSMPPLRPRNITSCIPALYVSTPFPQ